MSLAATASTGYLESFKLKARAWAQKVLIVVNTPVSGQMVEEKESLLKYARYIKKGIEAIFGTIEELENVGLGLLPLIPIAVVAASLAAIAKWTYDYNIFMKKIQEQRRLEADGIDPVTASNIVAKKNAPGFFNLNTKKLLPIAAIAGAFFWFNRKR